MAKTKILFFNTDKGGVNYYRTLTPAISLENQYGDDFDVEINSEIDFSKKETFDYLKSFNIIHYHKTLIPNISEMIPLAMSLKKEGVILVMDIDDYWVLDKTHPLYSISLEKNIVKETTTNLKLADYVTTTNNYFYNKIREITKKDNIIVLPNAIDVSIMKQFQPNMVSDNDDKVRICYVAGSSHANDVEQLEGVINLLNNDIETKNKFKIIVAGWDDQGHTYDTQFNDEFKDVLVKLGLWNNDTIKIINKTRGDIDAIPNLSDDIKNKYRNKLFLRNRREIDTEESVYLRYEKIFTDNYNIIKNKDYIEWLNSYEKTEYYGENEPYKRIWTKKVSEYATVFDNVDIVLAPLADNEFNRCKSNLKQVECYTRKLPIICSDIVTYNEYGKNGENCILIPNKKRNTKYWYKSLKNLILNKELRSFLGENLYNDFKNKFDLKIVTNKRYDFYKKILNNE